jgi:Tol biopolymer transport system component
MNQNGTGLRQLTDNADFDFDREWSPDGQKIAFQSDRGLFSEIFVMNADGTGQERLTVNGLPRDAGPVFSPDGRKLAFESDREGTFEIYKMRTDGARPVNLTNDPAGDFTPGWQHRCSSGIRGAPTFRTGMGRNVLSRPSNGRRMEIVRHERVPDDLARA